MFIWILATILFILIIVTSTRLKKQYQKNISESLNRLSGKSQIVETPIGVIEYSLKGDSGPFVLISHGGAGGFDQGLITAQSHLKGDYRIISVSRFGHLRTPMVPGANAELQADAYALLLDHLEIEKAAILSSSGGGPSAIQFAQRHSDKCSSLILSCAVSQFYPARPTSVYRSDFFYWFVTTKMKKLALKKIDVTKDIEKNLSDKEKTYINHLFSTMNPISLRREGLFCDIAEWANRKTWDTRYKLKEIQLPVLIIHAENDSVIPFTHALDAHKAISGSILMALKDGGHLKLGHLSEIQQRVNSFLNGDETK